MPKSREVLSGIFGLLLKSFFFLSPNKTRNVKLDNSFLVMTLNCPILDKETLGLYIKALKIKTPRGYLGGSVS